MNAQLFIWDAITGYRVNRLRLKSIVELSVEDKLFPFYFQQFSFLVVLLWNDWFAVFIVKSLL